MFLKVTGLWPTVGCGMPVRKTQFLVVSRLYFLHNINEVLFSFESVQMKIASGFTTIFLGISITGDKMSRI